MRRIYLFTLLLLMKICTAGAQTLDWAKSIGSNGPMASYSSDYAARIVYDNLGNSYIAGSFFVSMDADPGPGVHTITSTGRSPYIIKLDAAGNFVWAAAFDGTWTISSGDPNPTITIDKTGAVYVTGAFTGTMDFDPGPGAYTLTAPTSVSNVYICKLDPSGNFVWAKQIGNTVETSSANRIVTDSAGNLVFTGKFKSVVDFDPGPGVANLNAPFGAMFLCKFDNAGNYIWANELAAASPTSSGTTYTLAVDKTNQIYIGGSFTGNVDFDPGAAILSFTAPGIYPDIFIGKYDPAGNVLWAKQIGGNHLDQCTSISLDKSDNIYATGLF